MLLRGASDKYARKKVLCGMEVSAVTVVSLLKTRYIGLAKLEVSQAWYEILKRSFLPISSFTMIARFPLGELVSCCPQRLVVSKELHPIHQPTRLYARKAGIANTKVRNCSARG